MQLVAVIHSTREAYVLWQFQGGCSKIKIMQWWP